MLIGRSVPAFLWDEAIAHAVYLRNRALIRALPGKTPYEAYHLKKPDVPHLREFGCDVWVLDDSPGRSKLDPKANKMRLGGFVDGSKSVRYYDAKTRNVKVSWNTGFNESLEERRVDVPGSGLEEELSVVKSEVETVSGSNAYRDPQPPIPSSESETSTPTTSRRSSNAAPDPLPFSVPVREGPKLRNRDDTDFKLLANPDARTPADRTWTPKARAVALKKNRKAKAKALQFSDFDSERAVYSRVTMEEDEDEDAPSPTRYPRVTMEEIIDADAPLPRNVREAVEGAKGKEWKDAIEEELRMMGKMKTWSLEELPEGGMLWGVAGFLGARRTTRVTLLDTRRGWWLRGSPRSLEWTSTSAELSHQSCEWIPFVPWPPSRLSTDGGCSSSM